MSHLITEIDNVFTPAEGLFASTWHGLNKGLAGGIATDGSNILPCLRPIYAVGFKPDFDAPIGDAPAELAEDMGSNPINGWKILLSDARPDGRGVIPVHVVRKSYKVHQNSDLFKAAVSALDAVFGAGNYEIATVGTLGGHSQFFISVSVKDNATATVRGDEYKLFFNVVSSHNELVATGYHFSSVRVVCMNTVKAALADSDANGFKAAVKHTVNSGELITAAAIEANVRLWLDEKSRYFTALAALAEMPMTLDGFRAFAAGVFTNEGTDMLTSNSWNRISEMEALFARGKGNRGESVYDGINAFTEYFTSGNGVGRNVTAAKRLASASFGRGNEWKLEALNVASNPERLAATMKRGEMLFADKAKVMA